MTLQRNEAFYARSFLIHFDHRIAGGHHHLIRKTNILSGFGRFHHRGGMKWEEALEIPLFACWNDEFKSIQGWPCVKLVQFFAEGIKPIGVHADKDFSTRYTMISILCPFILKRIYIACLQPSPLLLEPLK